MNIIQTAASQPGEVKPDRQREIVIILSDRSREIIVCLKSYTGSASRHRSEDTPAAHSESW